MTSSFVHVVLLTQLRRQTKPTALEEHKEKVNFDRGQQQLHYHLPAVVLECCHVEKRAWYRYQHCRLFIFIQVYHAAFTYHYKIVFPVLSLTSQWA